jgi:Helix-turn-helix domain
MSDSLTIFRDVRKNSPLKGLARSVHLILASYANRFGVCWPSQQTIANEVGCTVRYVKKVITDLIKRGLVEVFKGGEDRRSNQYRVLRCNVNRGTVEQEIGELEDRDRGTVSTLPIYRQEVQEHPTELPTKTPAPSARGKEVSMIGEIPGDEPPPKKKERYWDGKQAGDDPDNPFDEKPRDPQGRQVQKLPSPGTHAWCSRFFENEATKAGHREFNKGLVNKTIKDLRTKHKLSYPEIEKVMRKFFIGHQPEVQAFQGNVAVQFRHMLPQLLKETAGTIQTQRRNPVKSQFQQENEEWLKNFGRNSA